LIEEKESMKPKMKKMKKKNEIEKKIEEE